MKYKQIILGGTFDRLHAGHKAFLRYAFSQGEYVLIGLTSDKYVTKEKKEASILPFAERKKELEEFLSSEHLEGKWSIVKIDSRYDQTQVSKVHDTALLVSAETYPSGLAVNKEREKNGLEPLPLIVMPLILSQTGEKISSHAIRSGLFDRNGTFIPQAITAPIVIPDQLRKSFHKPFGTLFMRDIPEEILTYPEKLVTVGDVTTNRIHDMGIQPQIAAVDFRVERKNVNKNLAELGFMGDEEVVSLQNPAGSLAPNVWTVLAELVKQIVKPIAITVEGEEDLLVIPLLLLLPIGYTILYGQPGEGLVAITVTEEKKQQLLQLLKKYL